MTYEQFIMQLLLLGWTKQEKNEYFFNCSDISIRPNHFYNNTRRSYINIFAFDAATSVKYYSYDKAMENIMGIMDRDF